MGERHTDMSDKKDSAKSMRERLSQLFAKRAPRGRIDNAFLKKAMKELKDAGNEGDDPQLAARVAVAEVVIPAVILDGGLINHEAVKVWAFALGQMIGYLAGISIQEDSMNGAIDEVASEAKVIAKVIHASVEQLQKGRSIEDVVKSVREMRHHKSDSSAPAKQEQGASMAEDLERQAEGELDPAAKAAMKAMAAQIRRGKKVEAA